MTELPEDVLVMISDEAGAGRIVVELGAFVRLNAAIDEQPFNLVKHRVVRGVGFVRTVHAADGNHAHRGPGFLHHADLDRAGLAAEEEW